jgi:TonB-dependent SusC/RagA subfamily outer membrane receptor
MNRTSTIRSGGFVSRDKQKIIWLLHRSAAVLLFLLLSIFSSAQTTTQVTGKVLDEKGQPIPGASIRVKGTTVATVSSASGNFTIVAAPTTTLTVTYVGYTTKDSPVNNQKTLTVSLTPSSSALNEVVVVGYGTQKKVNLTGAVSSVTSQEIVTTKNENVQNMLTGKVAGLTVVQNSSEPGAFDNTFDIRGMGSPLVIIDGIPRENITRLDPNDIESISVLKDASAAVYGVRAANGVVLVTTKREKRFPRTKLFGYPNLAGSSRLAKVG